MLRLSGAASSGRPSSTIAQTSAKAVAYAPWVTPNPSSGATLGHVSDSSATVGAPGKGVGDQGKYRVASRDLR